MDYLRNSSLITQIHTDYLLKTGFFRYTLISVCIIQSIILHSYLRVSYFIFSYILIGI